MNGPCVGWQAILCFHNPALSFPMGCSDSPFFFSPLKRGNLWQKSKTLEHGDGLRQTPGGGPVLPPMGWAIWTLWLDRSVLQAPGLLRRVGTVPTT